MTTKIKIGFVDDNELQQVLFKVLMDKSDIYDLLFICSNGLELLENLATCIQLPQICLLDLHMPQMGGIETAGIISEKYPSIKLFGYTSSIDDKQISAFKRNGVLYVFRKDNLRLILNDIANWNDKPNLTSGHNRHQN